MPSFYKSLFLFLILGLSAALPGCSLFHNPADIRIETYYVRYDLKTEAHQATADNLLMVPAQLDFRAEKFSPVSRAGVIPMTPEESKSSLLQQARETSLKSILKDQGLKSVKTLNLVTIASYEGFVRTPIQIQPVHNPATEDFQYQAHFQFAPVAFPDQWKELHNKYLIKQKLNEFFSLFIPNP